MQDYARLIEYLGRYPNHPGSQVVKVASGWHKAIRELPYQVNLTGGDLGITREQLRHLAVGVRLSPESEQPVLDLFWNVLVWGSGSDHRRVSRIAAALNGDRRAVIHQLRMAVHASHDGMIAQAYDSLHHLIPYWGPAFFTKYLAFAADPSATDRLQAFILDDRVRVAWRSLTGGVQLSPDPTGGQYEWMCHVMAQVAHQVEPRISVEMVEYSLFIAGGRIGAYTRWLETELALTRQRVASGELPVLDEIYDDL